MATRHFSWYLAKLLRFVSSELGNVSEVASLTALENFSHRPRCAMIQPPLVPSLHESPWGLGADVELAGGTVERCALAVHRR
jgi:hypothetical protein